MQSEDERVAYHQGLSVLVGDKRLQAPWRVQYFIGSWNVPGGYARPWIRVWREHRSNSSFHTTHRCSPGADPPLAGDELAVVKTVAKQIQDLIIVLNKSDRTTDGERAAAVEFTDRLLKKHLQRPVGPIFQISAAERLAEHPGPERDWDKLVEALKRLVQDSGRAIIHAACERGISRLSEQLLGIINEERDAPERPIEESERRIARMRETIAEAERSMRELGFLLMAEQQHLSSMFVRRHNAFLASVLPLANREFDDMLPTLPYSLGPSYRRRLNHEAQEIARRHVELWLKGEQEEAEREYRRVGNRFVQMGNDFLRMMGDAGIPELTRMPNALDPEVVSHSLEVFIS